MDALYFNFKDNGCLQSFKSVLNDLAYEKYLLKYNEDCYEIFVYDIKDEKVKSVLKALYEILRIN